MEPWCYGRCRQPAYRANTNAYSPRSTRFPSRTITSTARSTPCASRPRNRIGGGRPRPIPLRLASPSPAIRCGVVLQRRRPTRRRVGVSRSICLEGIDGARRADLGVVFQATGACGSQRNLVRVDLRQAASRIQLSSWRGMPGEPHPYCLSWQSIADHPTS